MQSNYSKIMMFSTVCIVINIVFGTLVGMLKIPLIFMDTMGTILTAALYGPFWGALVGLLTNVIVGITTNPVDIPFALVNMTIGLVVGFISKKVGFGLKTALFTGLLLSLVAPLIGTPIAIWIYGGLTGGTTDFFIAWLLASGNSIFTSAFIPRIAGNLVDKIASCLVAYAVITKLPKSYIKEALTNVKKS
jgi:energy-coupling factor transport system substrate-specific component